MSRHRRSHAQLDRDSSLIFRILSVVVRIARRRADAISAQAQIRLPERLWERMRNASHAKEPFLPSVDIVRSPPMEQCRNVVVWEETEQICICSVCGYRRHSEECVLELSRASKHNRSSIIDHSSSEGEPRSFEPDSDVIDSRWFLSRLERIN